jgi:hypothetical protein
MTPLHHPAILFRKKELAEASGNATMFPYSKDDFLKIVNVLELYVAAVETAWRP